MAAVHLKEERRLRGLKALGEDIKSTETDKFCRLAPFW
jgi:hypothetical protein